MVFLPDTSRQNARSVSLERVWISHVVPRDAELPLQTFRQCLYPEPFCGLVTANQNGDPEFTGHCHGGFLRVTSEQYLTAFQRGFLQSGRAGSTEYCHTIDWLTMLGEADHGLACQI